MRFSNQNEHYLIKSWVIDKMTFSLKTQNGFPLRYLSLHTRLHVREKHNVIRGNKKLLVWRSNVQNSDGALLGRVESQEEAVNRNGSKAVILLMRDQKSLRQTGS